MDSRRAVRLTAAWGTHIGKVRSVNEDVGCMVRLRDPGAVMAAVVDGMGGHGGGDVASRLAVRAIRRATRRPLPTDVEGRYEWLLQGIHDADSAIRSAGARELGLGAMGATVAAMLVTQEQCLLLHAGDCRAYHFRKGVQQFVTVDHSIVQLLIEVGTITPDQVSTHPMRSVVTSCLGGGQDARLTVDPRFEEGGGPAFRDLEAGDTLVLCSDGLWGEVPAADFEAIVAAYSGRPRLLVRACIEAALANGAGDNVTVAAICVRPARSPRRPPAL